MTKATDKHVMERAIEIALASEAEGNLPVGCVITLDGEPIAEGHSAVLEPHYHPGRHAEIVAIGKVDETLWPRAAEMTCYTTLEPCVMCAGTLLLHGVGRVVFGAMDTDGGAGCILDHLPPYYEDGGVYDWDGPLMPEACDPLYKRADAAFADLPVGRNQWTDASDTPSCDELAEEIETWIETTSGTHGIRRIRKAISELGSLIDDESSLQLLPYAREIFRRTGYLKDYRSLKRYAVRAGHLDVLDDVDATVRRELPDIWIEQALTRGEVEEAVACWYAQDEHRRLRHVADALLEATGGGDPELLISCRMSQAKYRIGRKSRRHYRRACAILRKLKDELDAAGASDYWTFVLEDVKSEYDRRPALLDELERAGF